MGYVDSVMVAPNGTEVARCSNTGVSATLSYGLLIPFSPIYKLPR